jgi:Right handed beta helix region
MLELLSRRRGSLALSVPGCALIAALLCVSAAPALADVTVGTGTPASCTSAALETAIAAGSGNITFACGAAPAVILITKPGGLVIPSGVQIAMDGSNKIELSGGLATRIFLVSSGGTLILKNLSIMHGFSGTDDGGAIRNDGTLTVAGCTFSNNETSNVWSGGAIVSYGPLNISSSEFRSNQAGNGGAIYPRFAAAVTTITDTTFDLNGTTNTTNGWGGAILVWSGANVTLTRNILHDNTALSGGAIFVEGASALTISASQFHNNSGLGGAIYNEGFVEIDGSTFQANQGGTDAGAILAVSGSTNIHRSSFTQNWAMFGGAIEQLGGQILADDLWFYGNGYDLSGTPTTVNGGAIEIYAGNANLGDLTLSGNWANTGGALYLLDDTFLTNVTISGNHADIAGGIEQFSGHATLTNVTIYQNTATSGAGGIHRAVESTGPVTVRNTIIANNTGGNCSGAFDSSAFNLSSDGTCGFGAGRDNVNPQLAALSNTGGYAPTHVPLPGSPAIDDASNTFCPTTDERGVVRAGKGAGCDVGAVEVDTTALALQTVVSRKTHGAAGTFDLTLGLIATNPTTEPRSAGAGGSHTIVFTFDQPVTSGTAAISAGTAVAGTPTFSGNSMIVPLSGVTNQQYVTVAVSNVMSSGGGTGSGSVRIGFLLGDVNQNRVVTLSDLGLVNAQLAQAVTAANYLKDVNASGTLTLADKGITNSNLTKALPAP